MSHTVKYLSNVNSNDKDSYSWIQTIVLVFWREEQEIRCWVTFPKSTLLAKYQVMLIQVTGQLFCNNFLKCFADEWQQSIRAVYKSLVHIYPLSCGQHNSRLFSQKWPLFSLETVVINVWKWNSKVTGQFFRKCGPVAFWVLNVFSNPTTYPSVMCMAVRREAHGCGRI